MMSLDQRQASSIGVTLLRVTVGLMYLAHGIVLKLLTFGLPGTAEFFVSIGLPAWLAYATFALEATGGAAILLGVKARWFAILLSPILLGALFIAHAGNGWLFTNPGGGWEYPAVLFMVSIALFLLGDGALAIRPSAPLKLALGRGRPPSAPGLA